MANYKLGRIQSDINKYLSNIILTEITDDYLKNITIIDSVVSKDLSHCKVYFTSLLDIDHKKLESIVNEKAPLLRLELAKVLNIRNIPELRFVYDTSIEYAQNIENILKDLD